MLAERRDSRGDDGVGWNDVGSNQNLEPRNWHCQWLMILNRSIDDSAIKMKFCTMKYVDILEV